MPEAAPRTACRLIDVAGKRLLAFSGHVEEFLAVPQVPASKGRV